MGIIRRIEDLFKRPSADTVVYSGDDSHFGKNENSMAGSNEWVFDSSNEFETWLSEYNFLEDAYILAVDKEPLTVTIGCIISGNYRANSERQILPFSLQPEVIVAWDFDQKVPSIPNDYYVYGIQALQVADGIRLDFGDPADFSLVANRIKVTQLPVVIDTFRPWTSDREFYVTANLIEIPTPGFWLEQFKKRGEDISYRYIYGERKALAEIPYPDYSGYFFQLTARIAGTADGIFIKFLSLKDQRFSVSFELWDKDLNSQFMILQQIVGEFKDVEIDCGNCIFSGPEWIQYLADGSLPNHPVNSPNL